MSNPPPDLFSRSPLAYCLQQMLFDEKGNCYDAVFIDVNQAFEDITGLKREQLLGQRESVLFPGEEFEYLRWFSRYGEVARGEGTFEHEFYYHPRGNWNRVLAWSSRPGFVDSVFIDITEEKYTLRKLVDTSGLFLQQKGSNVNYQQICELMLELSGAKFVVMNVYEESQEYFNLVAVAGKQDLIQKAVAWLGFNPFERRWKSNEQRKPSPGNTNVTILGNLQEACSEVIPGPIIEKIEEDFGLGSVGIALINREETLLGDLVFLMPARQNIRNISKIELFSRLVGIFLMQKKAENALAENENKYRRIFETIQDVYFETDINGKILEVSPSILSLSKGYSRDYLLDQQNVLDYYLDSGERGRLLEVMSEKGMVNDYGIVLINRLGEEVHCSISARIIFNQRGEVEKIAGVLRDVSHRLAAENALKASEERFRRLSESSSAGIIIVRENKFEFVNNAACNISGYPREELLGRHIFEIAHPEEIQRLQFMLQKREDGVSNDSRFELCIRQKNGQERWVDINFEDIDLEGHLAKVATVFDITERIQAEQKLIKSEARFRGLMDNAFDGIYLISDNRYLYVNDRFCEITGYSRVQLMDPGFNYEVLLTPEGLSTIRKRYQERGQGKQVPRTYELEIKTPCDTVKNVEVSTVRIQEDDKPFYIGIARDVTERRINEKLRQKVTLAQQATRFKQNFLANMSHEMRTPMNGIIGMTNIMAKSKLNPEQRNQLRVIEESSKTLLSLINDVLHLSKIEAGKVQLEKDTIGTRDFTRRINLLFSETARQKGLEFRCIASSGLPEYFIADENRLTQVISNLVTNAIKFTSRGYVRVYFRQIENYHDNLTLQFSVADSGVGIIPEHQEFIFEEFSQVDTSPTRKQQGTGLGLAISRRITGMLGGKLQVKSKPGRGSTFWFTFRAQKAFEGFIIENENTTEQQPDVKLGLHVLVVEDNLVNRLVVELCLKDMGCTVDTAENGLVAIEKIVRRKYDAVLMDIQMPVMDGITAVNELRRLKIKLPPIIGLSAEAMEGDAERYIAQGLDDYLTKPLDQELLKQKLGATK
jgi:PAS domain S-box-containing protein